MINLFQASAFVALVVNVIIGITVYVMNPRRVTNRYFLGTSLVLASWLACLAVGASTTDRALIILCIRYATATSGFILPAFDLLRLAIMSPEEQKPDAIRHLLPWLAVFAPILVLLHLPAAIQDVQFGSSGFPQPVYGWPQSFFIAYFIGGLLVLIGRFARDFRQAVGVQRAEMGFTVLASAMAGVMGVFIGQLIPILTGTPDVAQLLPLISILLSVVIAYGIATRRIMSVSDVLRRATSYALLVGYTVALYFVVFAVTHWALGNLMDDPSTIAHVVAAIVIAFSLAPAHGRSQEFASRLFLNVERMDVRKTVRTVQDALSQIGPLDDLTERFGDMVRSAAGTDRLLLLTSENGWYKQVYPKPLDESAFLLPATDDLVSLVRNSGGPVTVDGIRRLRGTPQREAAVQSLRELDSSLAAGVHIKDQMDAILLLGKRLSGRFYGPEEQDALQIVCNQFGVAFENAKLYTELQDSKIYNEILVDSLVSGIVAVNANGNISVFNKEAQRITGLSADEAIDHPLETLPDPLVAALRETLESGNEVLDRELSIQRNEEISVPVRLSCSAFQSYSGSSLGVLGVFSDLTLLKKLEEQVRRSDRLSSIGTLAAGMAHEIKNPLVSISTFTQLLPERYEEEDFRNTFSRLIGKEVKRIDSIVSRLLKFSRPAKPLLQSIHLHDALDDSINLISQQLRRKNITLVRKFDADNDRINGDLDLLSQAFINFFLNAIEAMEESGTLTISTVLIETRWYTWQRKREASRVRLSIADTGCGIEAKSVPKIFDPFFTSKSTGTGLGLSVSHSIIDEHDATLEVETEPGEGTTFHIFFPVLAEKETTE